MSGSNFTEEGGKYPPVLCREQKAQCFRVKGTLGLADVLDETEIQNEHKNYFRTAVRLRKLNLPDESKSIHNFTE